MYKKFTRWGALISTILLVFAAVYGWQAGIFTSQEAMESFIMRFGMAGGIVFILIQIIQVVVPIIPGGVSCLVGVLLFGAWKGFLYNYIGICIGSAAAFFIARKYGRALLHAMFDEKLLRKYEGWTQKNNRFTKLFALAIFFPVAPDDFLCYLAGTTKMRAEVFLAVILLGKPLSIAAYSMGLNVIFRFLIQAG